MNMDWHIAQVEVVDEDSDIISSILSELGCNGIEVEGIAGTDRQRMIGYFDASIETEDQLSSRLSSALAAYNNLASIVPQIQTKSFSDSSTEWKQHFKPFEIVPNIVVAPSWENYIASAEKKLITLDPGMAFGTGLHETTQLCARAIYDEIKRAKVEAMVDVGTGSGILAILGRVCGIGRIAGIENDPDALIVARENLEINGAPDIELFSDIDEVGAKFDLMVANILLLPLIALRESLIGALAHNARLILSGITTDQEDELEAAFIGHFGSAKRTRMGGWSAITFYPGE